MKTETIWRDILYKEEYEKNNQCPKCLRQLVLIKGKGSIKDGKFKSVGEYDCIVCEQTFCIVAYEEDTKQIREGGDDAA